jgi:hypothetical protein
MHELLKTRLMMFHDTNCGKATSSRPSGAAIGFWPKSPMELIGLIHARRIRHKEQIDTGKKQYPSWNSIDAELEFVKGYGRERLSTCPGFLGKAEKAGSYDG